MTAIDDTTSQLTADEQTRLALLDAYRALNELIGRVPLDIGIADWRIQHDGINCMANPPWRATDDEIRALMRRLADATRLEYAEKRHDDRQNMVTASGEIDGIAVKFWQLVKPCTCYCHAEAAVTA